MIEEWSRGSVLIFSARRKRARPRGGAAGPCGAGLRGAGAALQGRDPVSRPSSYFCAWPFRKTGTHFSGPCPLERQDHVRDLLPPARLLHVGELAAPAIGDPRLRDLGGVERVVVLDVFGPHDAGDLELPHFEIDPDFLLALDHEIAVR